MLIRNATAIMTGLPGAQARAVGNDLRIDADGRIAAIGTLAPQPGERVVDATDCVVYPGWVNTHHHLAQSVLKGVPAGLNLPLLGWLDAVPYRFRHRFDAELLARLNDINGLERIRLRPFRGRHRLAVEVDVEEDGARGFAWLAERGENERAVRGVVQ